MQLPLEFQKNMQTLLQEEYPDYLNSLEHEHFYGLRVNTAKISVADFLKISPFELKPIAWCADGFYYDGKKERPAKHPYYYAGLYYLQEPSAMLPAEVLDINDNDLILDGCAAPGGKSHQLLSKMSENAYLLSNDISISRCQPLSKNLRLTGRDNYAVISEDLTRLAEKMSGAFDKILLDAPCSGEGMFRKDKDLIKNWQERGNDYYSKIQQELVLCAWKMLKEGGKMVYSTCTFSPQEDEKIIRYMLEHCDDLHLLPLKKCAGFAYGKDKGLENCVKLFPHRIDGEGHFVALMQKGERRQIDSERKMVEAIVPEELLPLFLRIKRNWYNGKFQTVKVVNHNTGQKEEKIYFVKDTKLNMKKIRVVNNGLYLGIIKNKRFEPSNALALALKMDEFANVVNLAADDARVIKYLKGDTIELKDFAVENGYVLVGVDGFSLGFGKVNNGILKNKYEVGYRWQ